MSLKWLVFLIRTPTFDWYVGSGENQRANVTKTHVKESGLRLQIRLNYFALNSGTDFPYGFCMCVHRGSANAT